MDSNLLVLALYVGFAGLYLLVIPFITMRYVDQRWNDSGSWEKVWMFFLVFFFFPGMILLGPFANFRPQERSL